MNKARTEDNRTEDGHRSMKAMLFFEVLVQSNWLIFEWETFLKKMLLYVIFFIALICWGTRSLLPSTGFSSLFVAIPDSRDFCFKFSEMPLDKSYFFSFFLQFFIYLSFKLPASWARWLNARRVSLRCWQNITQAGKVKLAPRKRWVCYNQP